MEECSRNKAKIEALTREVDVNEIISDNHPQQAEINKRISLFLGDITRLEIDCVVNAAKPSLLGGGGVDGAIHNGAGKLLLAECREIGGCNTGESRITGGYNLPARAIIHTVGPVGENPEALQSCYKESLMLMLANDFHSIAFPCISTGIYGYPATQAAQVAVKTVQEFLLENYRAIDRIIFCVFNKEDLKIYRKLMCQWFPFNEDQAKMSMVSEDVNAKKLVDGQIDQGREDVPTREQDDQKGTRTRSGRLSRPTKRFNSAV